jgi:hypothetical protein
MNRAYRSYLQYPILREFCLYLIPICLKKDLPNVPESGGTLPIYPPSGVFAPTGEREVATEERWPSVWKNASEPTRYAIENNLVD